MSDSLRPHGLWPSRLLCPWDFPGKNIGLGCHFLLQATLLTQGSNPSIPAPPALSGRFLLLVPPRKPQEEVSVQ